MTGVLILIKPNILNYDAGNYLIFTGLLGSDIFRLRCWREDRQDLLWHRSGRMTTHYSAAELSKLIEAAESVCDRGEGKPELVVLRRLNVG